jgi:hypothetical protein
LLELLHGCKGLSAPDLLNTIIGGVLAFSHNEQIDDITLVVAKALPVASTTRQDAAHQLKAKA